MAANKPKNNSKKDVFESLLKSVTQSDYQNFVRQYAAKHKCFITEFELFFADKDRRIDVEKNYSKLISKLIEKNSTDGYIDYRYSYGLVKEINKYLATGREYIAKNNFIDAFALSKAVLKPMMETMAYCDDSDGELGDIIDNTVELLQQIISSKTVAINLKEEIFIFLQSELEDKAYFDYGDFGYNMFSVYQQLAVDLNKNDAFLAFIKTQLGKLTGQYDQYRREFFKTQTIAFLKETGKSAKAEELIRQNMDIVEVRMEVLNKSIKKKDYNEAKRIIEDGIKLAEAKSHPGTVDQWKKELLRIAKLEKDKTAVRDYTKCLAFRNGVSSEYYNQWKATFTLEEWRQTIEKHIAETIQNITQEWNKSKNKMWRSLHPPLLQDLAPIYILEKHWDRLLILVQDANNLNTTLDYHQYLVKDYSSALIAIYKPSLEEYGVRANDRKDYADLVRKMKKIIKDIPDGKNEILQVAKRLKERFSVKPRRPAMIEELNQILK